MDWFSRGVAYGLLAGGAVVGFLACAGALMCVVSFVIFLCTLGERGDEAEDAGAAEEIEDTEEPEEED